MDVYGIPEGMTKQQVKAAVANHPTFDRDFPCLCGGCAFLRDQRVAK